MSAVSAFGTVDDLVVVYVTAPEEAAGRLARGLIDRKLAGCVNVLPAVRSVYRWKGAVEEGTESLLIIKTTKERLPALAEGVKDLHPYEVPEIIALPITAGSDAYCAWLRENVAP